MLNERRNYPLLEKIWEVFGASDCAGPNTHTRTRSLEKEAHSRTLEKDNTTTHIFALHLVSGEHLQYGEENELNI